MKVVVRRFAIPQTVLDRLFRYNAVLFAFTAWPFFWYGTVYSQVAYTVIAALLGVLFVISGANSHRLRLNLFTLALLIFFASALLATGLSDHAEIRSKLATRVLVYVCLAAAAIALSSIQKPELSRACNAIIAIFILVSLPSVLILVAFISGVNLPYTSIDLGDRGNFYRLYPFGVIAESAIFNYPGVGRLWLVRIGGFFEEPGVLGTFVVFFIILNRFTGTGRSRYWKEAALHLLGTLSMSLFYFVSAAIFLAAWALRVTNRLIRAKGISRSSVVVLALVIVGVAVTVFWIRPGNPVYYRTVARLSPSDTGLVVGNSRFEYDYRVAGYLENAGLPQILLGNGPGANSLDASAQYSSWAADMYDTGLIAMLVVVGVYCFIALRFSIRNGHLSYGRLLTILPAVLSYYQRPDVISPIMIIFWITMARFAFEPANPSEIRSVVFGAPPIPHRGST